jgi:hypothetical protein
MLVGTPAAAPDAGPGLTTGSSSTNTGRLSRNSAGNSSANAEIRALKLGTWLGTPDGEFFALAVELAAPLPLRTDAKLVAETLKFAADLQQTEGSKVESRVSLVVLTTAADSSSSA